jgi:hypothetical protein
MTTPANHADRTRRVASGFNESNTVVDARQGPQASPADLFSPCVSVATRPASDCPQEPSDRGHPRIVEEHHIVGQHGQDQIEAMDDYARRWCGLRPEPRGRAGVLGFNYTWWAISILLLTLVLLPWPGWSY